MAGHHGHTALPVGHSGTVVPSGQPEPEVRTVYAPHLGLTGETVVNDPRAEVQPEQTLATPDSPEYVQVGKASPATTSIDSLSSRPTSPDAVDAPMPDHVEGMPTVDAIPITEEAATSKRTEDPGTVNLWDDDVEDMPDELLEGVSKEHMWTVIRRFNKQIYHVKKDPHAVPGELDLNTADEEEFSPDKLRTTIERLYMTVLIGLIGLSKHVARLRSWNERRRTSLFLLAYSIAWCFNCLLPLFFSLLVLLMLYPPARGFLFPPLPLAMISSTTGNLQQPRAGTLATGDSLTGAPEAQSGEAVEQEASNMITGFAAIAVGAAMGKHPDGDAVEKEGESQPLDKSLPDPTNFAATAVDVKDTASGKKAGIDRDKTKQPMEALIWTKAGPFMRAIAGLTDMWEMFQNAFDPTPPFNAYARYKLAGMVAPMILVTMFVDMRVLVKTMTFVLGFLFFGGPLISRGTAWLDHRIPKWQRLLDLRKSILKGVPTNAQLALTLLRIGEANRAPLPPPPITDDPLPSRRSSPLIKHSDLPEDLKTSDVDPTPPPSAAPEEAHGYGPKKDNKHKFFSRIAGVLKGTTRAGVAGVISADRVKAAVGSEQAKRRRGVLPRPNREQDLIDGPSVFTARYRGAKGYVVISTTATTPCVSFVADNARKKNDGAWTAEWSVSLDDIVGLKKIGGLSWKGKLIVGWAYERPVYDGLEITDAQGKTWALTAIMRRDELFNRLVAVVGHQWESW